MSFTIVPHADWTAAQREAAAAVLVRGFAHQPAAWNTMDEAREEVDSFFEEEDRAAWALCDGDAVAGWIGRVDQYDGNVWELHPIVVDPARQRGGLGRRLVAVLEAEAAKAGVLTIQLGTDDDYDGTDLYGADLYDDLPGRIARARVTNGHPLDFYRRLGFVISGVVPDANGPGKPDILMAKRVPR